MQLNNNNNKDAITDEKRNIRKMSITNITKNEEYIKKQYKNIIAINDRKP